MDHPLPFHNAEAALRRFDALSDPHDRAPAAYVVADAFLACVPVTTPGHDTPREVIARQLLADLPGAPVKSKWLRDVLASEEYRRKRQEGVDILQRLFTLKDAFSST